MDLRQSKPVHYKCSNCGHDISLNTNKIVAKRQELRARIAVIDKQLSGFKNANNKKNIPEYKRLLKQKKDISMQLQALNQVNRNLCENAELEKFKVFYRLVKSVLGEKRTLELIKDAEDSLVYHDYDTAVQRYNNFSGC